MPSNIILNNGADSLALFLKLDGQRRLKEKTELIALVQNSPLSESDFNKLIWLGPGDWEEVMRHHPGYSIDQCISSLKNILSIFMRAWGDLSKHLDAFDRFAAQPDSMNASRQDELEEFSLVVRKEVFVLATSAKALADVSRGLKTLKVPGFQDRIDNEFSTDGQHRFVTELRNSLSHSWFAPAEWRVKSTPEGMAGFFTFSRDDLLHNGRFNQLARSYIQASGKSLNVRELFKSYVSKVSDLYSWLWIELDNHLDAATIEFRRCKKARRANARRSFWKLIFPTLSARAINPYDYLGRYLTAEELTKVMELPLRSRQQVDQIIAFVDKDGACDDDLRQKAYALFGVSVDSDAPDNKTGQ